MTKIEEEWLEVPSNSGYRISSLGRLFSKASNRVLSPEITKSGYIRYTLGRRSARFSAHRLVMLAFVGPSDRVVNHINGNKSDNSIANLEYSTIQENNRHCCSVLKKRVGENHANARFTDEDVREMRRLHDAGMKQIQIAPLFNARQGTISNILRGFTRATAFERPCGTSPGQES